MRSLFGLRMAMTLPSFQIWGILECWLETLLGFVRADISCGPRCFKCKLEMLSEPVACEFLMIFCLCGSEWRDGGVELAASFASCNTSFLFSGSYMTCVCVVVSEDVSL